MTARLSTVSDLLNYHNEHGDFDVVDGYGERATIEERQWDGNYGADWGIFLTFEPGETFDLTRVDVWTKQQIEDWGPYYVID